MSQDRKRFVWIDIAVIMVVFIILVYLIINRTKDDTILWVDKECCDQFCYEISGGELVCKDFVGMTFTRQSKNTIYCELPPENFSASQIFTFKINEPGKVCQNEQR